MIQVMAEKCDECLFSSNKIVTDETKQQVLARCAKKDAHFICHKATVVGKDAVCNGFYKTRTTNLLRMAQRLEQIQFVNYTATPLQLLQFAMADEA
jgi:hypothetical protein